MASSRRFRSTRRVYDATGAKDIENILGGELASLENNYKKATFRGELKRLLFVLQKDHRTFFEQDVDATGAAWPPLAPATIRKKGHDTILEDTRNLRDSLTKLAHSDAIRDLITGGPQEAMTFGTSDEKAYWHQHGTRKMPARPPVGMTDERLGETCERVADELVRQLLAGL